MPAPYAMPEMPEFPAPYSMPEMPEMPEFPSPYAMPAMPEMPAPLSISALPEPPVFQDYLSLDPQARRAAMAKYRSAIYVTVTLFLLDWTRNLIFPESLLNRLTLFAWTIVALIAFGWVVRPKGSLAETGAGFWPRAALFLGRAVTLVFLVAAAVNEMVSRTSTEYAPWHLIPANNKKYARVKVLNTICERLEQALQES